MTTLKALKQELLADAEARAAYDGMTDEFAIVRALVAALSQSEVAQRMGTTQSAVADGSGKRLPSMRTVERFAQAVGGYLVFRIE